MADATISEFISRMTTGFIPEKAAGIDALIQLKLSGAQAGEWFITVKDKSCTIQPGAVEGARLTVSTDSESFMKIFTGQMDAMQAYMQGKIKITGDLSLALKLLGLFKVR